MAESNKLACNYEPKDKIGCVRGSVVYKIGDSYYIEIKYDINGSQYCDLLLISRGQRPSVDPC